MRITVRKQNVDLSETLNQHIERRMLFALGRFQRRIRRVTVRVCDINGPCGSVDKTCQVVVDLIPSGKIIVKDTDGDLYAAISRAVERVGRTVGRQFARRREIRRDWAAGGVGSERRKGMI